MNNQMPGYFPNMPNMPYHPNMNQGYDNFSGYRQLENRVNRLERDVRRLENKVNRLENGYPVPLKDNYNANNYQPDSYNMM